MDQFINTDTNFVLTRTLQENILRQIGAFTDLILKSSDNFEYRVHKLVLTSASPYFSVNLLSLTDEISKNYDKQKKCLVFECDMTGSYLKEIIDYIYTGKYTKPLLTVQDAKDLYNHANYFQLEKLKNFAIYSMGLELKESKNVLKVKEIYGFAVEHKMNDLINDCVTAIVGTIENFFDEFLLDLKYEELNMILMNSNLVCSQEYIYLNVLKWVKFKNSERCKFLKDLLQYVNFSKISYEFKMSKILVDRNILKFSKCFRTIFDKNNTPELHQKDNLKSNLILNDCQKETLLVIAQNNLFEINEKYELKAHHTKAIFSLNSNFTPVVVDGDSLILLNGLDCKMFSIKEPDQVKSNKMFRKNSESEAKVLHESVYVCGGLKNTNNTDILNLASFTWMKGPPMINKHHHFGLINYKNSLYTFGGYYCTSTLKNQNVICPSSTIEHFDPRINLWKEISSLNDQPLMVLTKSICINDCVYCFTQMGGNVFDMRQSKWIDSLQIPPAKLNGLSNFSVANFNNQIIVSDFYNNQFQGFFEYCIETSTWLQLDVEFEKNISPNVFDKFCPKIVSLKN